MHGGVGDARGCAAFSHERTSDTPGVADHWFHLSSAPRGDVGLIAVAVLFALARTDGELVRARAVVLAEEHEWTLGVLRDVRDCRKRKVARNGSRDDDVAARVGGDSLGAGEVGVGRDRILRRIAARFDERDAVGVGAFLARALGVSFGVVAGACAARRTATHVGEEDDERAKADRGTEEMNS